MKNNKILTIWKRFQFDRERKKTASLADVIYKKACNTEALHIYHEAIRRTSDSYLNHVLDYYCKGAAK